MLPKMESIAEKAATKACETLEAKLSLRLDAVERAAGTSTAAGSTVLSSGTSITRSVQQRPPRKAPRFFRKVELTAFADMKPVAANDMPSICAVDMRGTSAAESVAAELDVFLLQLEEPIPDD